MEVVERLQRLDDRVFRARHLERVGAPADADARAVWDQLDADWQRWAREAAARGEVDEDPALALVLAGIIDNVQAMFVRRFSWMLAVLLVWIAVLLGVVVIGGLRDWLAMAGGMLGMIVGWTRQFVRLDRARRRNLDIVRRAGWR